jgi:hypothetical protein
MRSIAVVVGRSAAVATMRFVVGPDEHDPQAADVAEVVAADGGSAKKHRKSTRH